MTIFLENDSKYFAKKGETDWWNWTAYIVCTPPDSYEDIEFVEYHLPPSYRSPIERVRSKDGGFLHVWDGKRGFPFSRQGWAPFYLKARVVFKDKSREPLPLNRLLEFEPPPKR